MIEEEFSALSLSGKGAKQHTLKAVVRSTFGITGSCGLYVSSCADSR